MRAFERYGMRLLPDPEALANGLSALMQKGGWLIAPLGGMALLYLLQDKLVFNPVNTPGSLYRASGGHRGRAVTCRTCRTKNVSFSTTLPEKREKTSTH